MRFVNEVADRCRLLVFLAFIFPIFSTAQSIRTITTSDGLPQSFVSGLVQDDSSFIWIGTRNGIARFDGINYKIFQHHPYDTTSLSSNVIIWLKKDKYNKIWVEHESGEIDMLDPVTEKITHLLKGNVQTAPSARFVRRGWMIADDGKFWGIIRSAGLNVFDNNTKLISRYTKDKDGLGSDTVRSIVQTNCGEMWVPTQQSLTKYNKQENKFENYYIPWIQDHGQFPESDAIAIDLKERNNGELIWGDRNNLYFFHPSSAKFRSVKIPTQGYMGLRWIRTGKNNTEYFETYGKLYSYNDQNGVQTIGNTGTHEFGEVKSFLVDRSGVIWMGTDAKGIRQVDIETPYFTGLTYSKDFATDMLQQEFGIDIEKQFDWSWRDLVFSLPGYHLRTVFDKNGRLYFALKESVGYIDANASQLIRLPVIKFQNDSTDRGIGIKGISVMPDGSPAVITFNGKIFNYNFETKDWKNLIDPKLLRKQFGNRMLPQDLYIDNDIAWITTGNSGLLAVNLRTNDVKQFRQENNAGALPANQLIGICPDPKSKDVLWIGSYQGLIRFNKSSFQSQVYSLNEGLPDNTIYSILPDQQGKLWITTNKGIARFDPSNAQVRVFRTEHGLPGDEFNRFHHIRLNSNELAFGGTQGWVKFDPIDITEDKFEPTIALTNLRINNEVVVPATKGSDLQLPLNATKRLVLPYEKNTINISFAGLEFTQPHDLLYRYRLEGYDKDWVNAGSERQATYTKLPPGNYKFLVNASNTTGKWSPYVKAIEIKVESPWWLSWTAYFCYLLIVGSLIALYIRIRVSRALMKNSIRIKEKEAMHLKELDEMKTRFFSNITHEFRTPLTLIMGPAETLKTVQSDPARQLQLADTIVSNSNQLLVLINRLMDLSKLEAKAMKLHEQRGDPAAVIKNVLNSFFHDSEKRHVALWFKNYSQPCDCIFYPEALERIVYNLVSNALKFTHAGGKVEVSMDYSENALLLSVEDNGVGIPLQKLPYIYDRYYQAGDPANIANELAGKGTGIGLAIVKELITLLKGSIEVSSGVDEPSGTVFNLVIPISKVGPGVLAETAEISIDVPDDLQNDKPRILIIEDNPELAGFISDSLGLRYEINTAANGSAGLLAALEIMPDLIISDVMMPVMDGFEFTSKLRQDIRTTHIPVILLTAKTGHEHMVEGLSSGADDYLTKPFSPAELTLKIGNHLSRQEKLRQRLKVEFEKSQATNHQSAQKSPIEDIFLQKLNKILDEHLDDSLFGVDQIADIMNISRSSLHRKLKALTGMSTTEVVRNYRLKKATEFLRAGFSSSETAYKSGFSSPAYFTKSFREVYGVTPGEYKA